MGPKVVQVDRVLARIAARQHGVVSIWQLRPRGIGRQAVSTRIRAGRLHRVHRGVYAVGHASLSAEGRSLAAVLAIAEGADRGPGPVLDHWGAAVSHSSAAALWDLTSVRDGPVDVVVRRAGGRGSRHGIRVHRASMLSVADVTLRRGIPVTTPARTISDLEMALAAGHPGALPEHELRRATRQASVLGLPLSEDDPLDRTRSDLEAELLALCRRHRLPEPEVNVRLGPYLVDFLWPDRRLVVETDAYRYHRGRAAFRDDHRRDLRLRQLGYDVMRISDDQLAEDVDEVVESLIESLRGEADASVAGTERPDASVARTEPP